MRQQTIKYNGKIFALECGCKDRGEHSYVERALNYDLKYKYSPGVNRKFPSLCSWCGLYPWIILPKEEKP